MVHFWVVESIFILLSSIYCFPLYSKLAKLTTCSTNLTEYINKLSILAHIFVMIAANKLTITRLVSLH